MLQEEAMVSAPVGHVYRMVWWFKAFALFVCAIGLLCLSIFVRNLILSPEDLNTTRVAAAFVSSIVGSLMAVKSFTSRVSISETAIEMRWAMRSRSMQLAGIRGRREYVARGGKPGGSTRYLRLEGDGPPLDFGKKLYRFDDAFWQWFNQLPDLDAREKEVHKDSNFGLV